MGEIINQDSVTEANTNNNGISINYNFNKQDKITYFVSGWNFLKADFYISQNEKKYFVKLLSKKNYLRFCFKYRGNDFLYIQNSGNEEHKYGLIEILDLDKFIKDYCQSASME